MKNINTLILTASLGLAAAAGARADVLFNTDTSIYYSDIGFRGSGRAQSFKTGASPVTLTDVELRMMAADNTSGGFTVNLRSDNGGTPGATLAALAGSANPGTAGDYTYTATQVLSADTFYWVDAEVSAGGGVYNWPRAVTPTPLIGTSLEPQKSYSLHNGSIDYANWENFSMKVNVSSGGPSGVPDSGSSALLGLLGLGGLAAWQRRTRQAQ